MFVEETIFPLIRDVSSNFVYQYLYLKLLDDFREGFKIKIKTKF